MELTPELLGTGIVGLIVILCAVGQYLRSLRAPPPAADPVLTGIGVELGNRQQLDLLIAEVKRIADALTDKNTAGINDRIDALTEIVARMLAERPKPPARRRAK